MSNYFRKLKPRIVKYHAHYLIDSKEANVPQTLVSVPFDGYFIIYLPIPVIRNSL